MMLFMHNIKYFNKIVYIYSHWCHNSGLQGTYFWPWPDLCLYDGQKYDNLGYNRTPLLQYITCK